MRSTIVTALLLVLAACASAPADEPADGAPSTDGRSAASTDRVLTGVLGGDPDLEGGCVWLDTDEGRVEVLWPDGYRSSADPVELRAADGAVVAEAGDEVAVRGAPASDRVSTCQVGTLWTATSVEVD